MGTHLASVHPLRAAQCAFFVKLGESCTKHSRLPQLYTVFRPASIHTCFIREDVKSNGRYISVQVHMYRVPQKNVPERFLAKICSRCPIILFHMCFTIRILSPFHLNTLNIPIQNINCPKNIKTHERTSFYPQPLFVKLELCQKYSIETLD